ncbi:MAG: FAD-dependent oxidoreductase [Sphingomonas sp.]|uniref:NAD(P)/FAD-dependent oxidoreductase n=1 Tax=Sphingomonas sp. TaxID=28214 RepID=UPI00262AACE7|nr:FAD-dependent oxidoreductase [Sphingomonas sp.]MDK2766086.1 FAD-dependent oxidoreductase [Sphingomonas sp.]
MSVPAGETVIVGGGQAGARLFALLRTAQPSMALKILCDEATAPYERPPLSKTILEEGTLTPQWVNDVSIYRPEQSLCLGRAVRRIDRQNRLVVDRSGNEHRYDTLIIATGAGARRLPEPPAIPHHYLRDYSDAAALRETLGSARSVLVLGGGAIGTEIAAIAVRRGLAATIVEAQGQLLSRSLHPALSERILSTHVKNGVQVYLNRTIAEYVPSGVVLSDGTLVEADAMVVSIGVQPNDAIAREAGLETRNGILTGPGFVTSDPAIYAIGDVANYFEPFLGDWHRSESWDAANLQAEVAAAAILNRPLPAWRPPKFWTEQFDDHYQFCGDLSRGAVLFESDNSTSFVAKIVHEDRLVGICTRNAPRDFRRMCADVEMPRSRQSTEHGEQER